MVWFLCLIIASGIIKTIIGGDKGVHTFPRDFSLKVNAVTRLEFEHIYYDVAVQHVSHYSLEDNMKIDKKKKKTFGE